jgi:DNA-binding Lrp family transcriptional regulator
MARLKLTWEQREFIDRKKRRSKDYDTKILMMFHKIEYFQNKYGYCNKTNEYFQRILNVSHTTVKRYLDDLENLGLIKRETDSGNYRKLFAIRPVSEEN